MKYCFGVDLGGTTVKMGLFSSEGEILEKWEIPTRREEHGAYILPDIAASIHEKCSLKNLGKEEIIGVGIGVPAPVDQRGIVKGTVNLGWGYKNVKEELEELTGLRVKVGNDANMAALGEMWLGAGKGEPNLIMLTLGTGVGGGILVDGVPLVGTHGAGGEVGHMKVNLDEKRVCGCGKRGCLEQYASATGIAYLAEKRLAENDDPTPLRDFDKVTAKEVFDCLKAGDSVAEDVVETFGRYLGMGIANIAAVCDPTVAIIGGGVSKAGPILLDYVKKYYQEYVFFADKDLQFVLAELGNDAGICGAAKLVL
ncbi:MAG: ROK family glucokinase [Dorea sp.]|nr:ROK family glucokinase [Dorea sp.]